jgi:hypothetical protein
VLLQIGKWLMGGVLALLLLSLLAANIFGRYLFGYTRNTFGRQVAIISKLL